MTISKILSSSVSLNSVLYAREQFYSLVAEMVEAKKQAIKESEMELGFASIEEAYRESLFLKEWEQEEYEHPERFIW